MTARSEQLYVVSYQDDSADHGREFFIATSAHHAIEQFEHLVKEEKLHIKGTPQASQTYIETYQHTPEGAYGPRARLPEENHVLMSPPTVGCCDYMACGQTHCGETSGKPVSEPGSEPAE